MNQMTNRIDDFFKTRKCKVCKKEFIIHGEYAYRRELPGKRVQYFCSWKCLRANETQPRRKKGNPKSEYATKICEMLSASYTIKQICEKLNVTPTTVKYWQNFGDPIMEQDA